MFDSENRENEKEEAYIAIDMKSFYASVECVARALDPLRARLLVADESRTDQTICLAVSPALKALGVPARPRLFEAKQAIRRYEIEHHTRVPYYVATPRMAEYERVSAQIYGICLRYAAAEDIHVYSIDENFICCTPYLSLYRAQAEKEGVHPAHAMAMTIIYDILRQTGITATVGIGTNLYLAKIAMDIVAKKKKADAYGVRIAELNPLSYRYLLWDHRPLTDFWQIGRGKARRLEQAALFTMGDIAEKSQYDEEFFYRTFGIDGEILIDHAWGEEPVTIREIRAYKPERNSLSNGQVLPRPYEYAEARIIFREMVDVLCADMMEKGIVSSVFSWYIGYDYKSLEHCPAYSGPMAVDFYGRLHPKHHSGIVRLSQKTSAVSLIASAMLDSFDKKTDHRLLFRRVGVNAAETVRDEEAFQMDLFADYDALAREQAISRAMLEIRRKYGKNALVKGFNLLPGAMTRERNTQIGGHRA